MLQFFVPVDILRNISEQINAAITELEEDDGNGYAQFVTAVCALLVSTLPNVTRYDLYEIVDLAFATARQNTDQRQLMC
jgi:hypothetical protein